MHEVVLHAGMHKTGSTSIQKSLAGHETASFRYFRNPLGFSNHSTYFFSLMGSMGSDRQGGGGRGRHVSRLSTRMTDGATAERALDEAMATIGSRRLVLSGEGAMLMAPDELAGLRDHLRARGGDPVVYAYVRPPVGYATSLFQQQLKNANAPQFNMDARFCNYRERFGKFDRVFGRDRVRLRRFDPASFAERCVVRDFCGWTGLDFDGEVIRANESLNVEVVRLLFVHHRMAARGLVPQPTTLEMRYVVRQLAPIEGGRLRFAPSLMRPYVAARADDIAWIEERMGTPLTESLGEDRPDDIQREEDLWRVPAATVDRLREVVGAAAPAGTDGNSPETIARLIDTLRPPPEPDGLAGLPRRMRRYLTARLRGQ